MWGGGGRFHSQARIFVPLQVAERFFYLEKGKIQDGQCAQFSPNNNGCFPGTGMKDSKEILEFYYNFLQCIQWHHSHADGTFKESSQFINNICLLFDGVIHFMGGQFICT